MNDQKFNQFVKDNDISIYDLLNNVEWKQKAFLDRCLYGFFHNPSELVREARKYFEDKNHSWKFKELERDIKLSRFVFIWHDTKHSLPEKVFFSSRFVDMERFKVWLESWNDGSVNPVGLIIDGVMSKTKFETKHIVKFKIEESE